MSRRHTGKSANPGNRPEAAWLWGRHAVEAALRNPRRPCLRLLATSPALARLEGLARRDGLVVETVPPDQIARRVGTDEIHQGLALEVGPLPAVVLDTAVPDTGSSLVLALDQISDPRNLGAILRSAAAFGVDLVIVPERRSAEAGGAAARAAAGGLDLVAVAEVVNLARSLAELKERGYWIVGLDGAADLTIDALPPFERVVLVLGSEGAGLRRLVAERCDRIARIPIAAAIDSLNVAVAAGVALHALRQRLADAVSS